MEQKDLSRALRRHHRARLKKTRQQYWGHYHAYPWTPAQLGKVVQYPAQCSCTGCGNPRNWFGTRTLAEKRVYQDSVWDALDSACEHDEK
jgi:hypothetical protein